MKSLVIIALIIVSLFVGYMAGVIHATSSDEWIEEDDVDGQLYSWKV